MDEAITDENIMDEEIFDSPDEWVAEHIRRYVETGGQARPGTNDLLLTTRGRRSGKLRRTALVFVRDGDHYVLAASNAGADRHPAWYLNVVHGAGEAAAVGTHGRGHAVLPAVSGGDQPSHPDRDHRTYRVIDR
jgi:deazaflavin-dependent oxidoreductase (nitroreductase family)